MRSKKFIDIPAIEQFYRIDEDGAVFSLRKQRYLKPTFNSAGYLFVHLQIDNSPEQTRFYGVHRLVATKHLGQCPIELETSHSDGNKMNNHYSNFEYITHAKNILKSYSEHGRKARYVPYTHKRFSDETKELMSNLKKKPVKYSYGPVETIFPSIEDAAQSLSTYRRKIYVCIKDQIPFQDGFLSFA